MSSMLCADNLMPLGVYAEPHCCPLITVWHGQAKHLAEIRKDEGGLVVRNMYVPATLCCHPLRGQVFLSANRSLNECCKITNL